MSTFLKIQDQAIAWLRANGIEPNNVLIDEVPTVGNGEIRCRVVLRYPDGRMKIDGRGDPMMRAVVVPLVVPPPAALAGWLGGQVRVP